MSKITKLSIEEQVEALITNDASVWTEEDRKFLMTMPEEKLAKLATDIKTNAISEKGLGDEFDQEGDSEDDESKDGTTDDVAGSKTAGGKASAKKKTMNAGEYIADAPAEIREVLNEGMLALNAEKQKLTNIITANKANEYTKAELSAMSMDSLRKLAKLSAPVANIRREKPAGMFAGNGIVENETSEAAKSECLPLPAMTFEKSKS